MPQSETPDLTYLTMQASVMEMAAHDANILRHLAPDVSAQNLRRFDTALERVARARGLRLVPANELEAVDG